MHDNPYQGRVHRGFCWSIGVAWAVACASACVSPCPDGYDAKLDQCVKAAKVTHPCAVLGETKLDDGTLLTRVDETNGTCFWMDQTEVTVGAYSAWLKDGPAVTQWDKKYCSWKTHTNDPVSDPSLCSSALSAQDQDPFGKLKPIRCIDFCDAEAFCRSNGKNLCYDFQSMGTGGPRGYPREWRIACTNDLTTVFPWGDQPNEGLCQTGQTQNGCTDNACGPTTVGQRARCHGPSGVLDLIGNVAEWTYACTAFDPLHPSCLVRGGSYVDLQHSCETERSIANDTRPPDVGFRCCEDLSAAERGQLDATPAQ